MFIINYYNSRNMCKSYSKFSNSSTLVIKIPKLTKLKKVKIIKGNKIIFYI